MTNDPRRPHVLAVDPGLAYIGLAWIELLPEGERVIRLDTFASPAHERPVKPRDPRKLKRWERRAKKTTARQHGAWKREQLAIYQTARRAYVEARKTAPSYADDMQRRGRLVAVAFREALQAFGGAVAVCAETMPFLRDAGSTAKIAVTWGILIAECERARVPLVTVSPMRLKLAVTGSKTAEKEEVQAALIERYPRAATLLDHLDYEAERPHPWDALGAAVACLDRLTVFRPSL